MKLTKQLKAEITDMYEAFWGALFYADIDMYSLFLDEDYRLIGTTEQEFFFSKAEAVRFLQATADQLAGNLERRNSRHKIEIIDNLVFITDQFDAYVLIDDKWSFYEKTRVTTLIQEKKNGWKIIQQHFSFPDNKAGSGQTIGLEKIAKENLQLKEAIRRRTIELELKNKELEIEFSLERVRAVAMGMKQPADMLEVCEVIARELISLGVGPIRNIQTAVIDTEKETYQNYEYYQVAREKLVTTVSYKEHPIVHAFVKRMVKDPEGFYARRMKGEGLKKWIKYQAKAGQFVDPTSTKAASLHYYFYSIGSGALGITTYAPLSKEAIALFKRFRNVFQLAYARFIDIQQAVAQAREAQIELALERVRAGAMAMRQSDELGQLIFVLYQELTKLDAKLDRCFIMIVHPENQGITWWMAGQEGLLAENGFFIQTNQHASHLWYLDCWKKRKKKWQYLLEGKEKRDWDRFGFTKTELTRLPEPVKKFMAGVKKIQLSGSSDQFGSLVTGSFEPLPEEHQEIINRFAVAFNQAYIRFLDLQKAEDQAREAQIQLAMERVRARTMAMQGSNELPVAANLLFQQVQSLGMPAWSAGYCIWDEKKQGVTLWMSSEGVMQPAFHAPLTKDPSFIHMREAFEKGRDFHVEEVGGKALVAHYKYMRTLPVVGEVLDSIIAAGHPLPVYQIFHCVYFSHGFLLFITYEPVPEAHVIFKRFGTVFDQTYTRFLDLQKAEAQTREAQIEASLERVRSRAMAMHSSAELTEVALELRKQMGRIGQKDLEVCAIHLYDDEHSFESWSAMKVPGSASEILQTQARFPKKGIRIVDELMKKYRAGEKDYVIVNAGAKSVEWFSVLKEYAPELHASIIEAIGDMPLKRLKSNWSVADFSGGALVMVTYGEPNPISRNLLRRSANVFEQAYIRFLDLRKAEAQAREAKIEAALERVRSRSMAMHKSEELADLSLELVKQVQALGVATWFCAFNIYDDEKGSVEWGSNGQGTFPKYRTPREGVFLRYFEAGQKGESLLINEIGKEECPAHYEYLCTLPGVGDQLLSMKRAGIPFPDAQIDHVAFFRYGYIIYITYAPAPESHEIFIRFAKVFEQTYTRFLDLQKSEAQAREAKIEAALERVRSRSLAMHHSSELSAVVDTLLREFTNLEFTLTFCIINLINEDDKSNTVWAANPEEGKDPESYYMKFEDYPFHHAMWKAWKAQDKRFVYTIEGEEKRIYDQYLYTDTEFSRFPENVKQANRALERYVAGFTFFRYSGLQTVSVNAITEAELEILERFGRVFEQSYTRFLDLQKAEAQAREAQIEAALERVRSRSMAMHKSDELLEAGEILFLEMQKLGIESLTAGYVLMDKGEKNGLNYTPHPGTKKIMPAPVIIPHNETIHMQQVVENWKKGKSFFIVEMDEEETIKHQTFIAERSTNFPLNASQLIAISPTRLFLHNFYFEEGYLLNVGGAKLSAEQTDIMLRFAKVFQQTYTRFLDLQKAEAQAREAQIEAALERVRSKTMAMHNSNDVGESVAALFDELTALGVLSSLDRCGIGIMQPDEMMELWTAEKTNGKTELTIGHLNMQYHPLLKNVYQNWLDKNDTYQYILEGEDKHQYYEAMRNQTDYKIRKDYYSSQERIVHTDFFFKEGCLYVFSQNEFTAEASSVFIRFVHVFGQTYRRYLDLRRAEAQAREAQIETALEKVRSRTLAMQKSDELAETASVLFQQLILLGIEPNRLYITIIHAGSDEADFWITNEDGSRLTDAYSANLEDNSTFKKMYEGWKKQLKHLVIDMQGEELQNYFHYLQSKHVPFKGGLEQKRRVQHLAYFSKGFIGLASPEEQPAESVQLLERFAAVFNLTFTRFNDLQIAEAHAAQSAQDLIAIKEAKQKAEEALTVLQATQKQLVQSEKMASLGELTAGIAHEIQNPLNFVNNFSEVSKELLDEMREAIEKGDTEEAKEIMDDVIQNLEKINHHGKRADGIVKGMLQHSRSSSGVKEPTDINALADEYLRLAYHGLRAKDKSFNAILKTEFDDTIGTINIIPQDIGRVILNLITNAFYAVDEKKKQQPAGYEPAVIVTSRKISTSSGGAGVLITVKDNGNGIPQQVIDKIFQPFFTTKPTGQGTGLGLSLSYDIVKAHGGELKVETKDGEGSEFIMVLPI